MKFLHFPNQVHNTFCGPEKESCVANQTLKDKSCLVSCTGLYADIADDSRYQSMQQNMMKGIIILLFDWLSFTKSKPGLRGLTRRLDERSKGLDFESEFEQIFSMPMDKEDKLLRFLTERYVDYKVNYAKQLLFNPDSQNLSKLITFSKSIPMFRWFPSDWGQRVCTTRVCLHLL